MTCFLLTCVFILTTTFWFGLLGYGLKLLIGHIKKSAKSRAATQQILTQILGHDETPTE